MRPHKLFYGCLAVLLLAGAAAGAYLLFSAPGGESSVSIQERTATGELGELRAVWRTYIEEVGPKNAYAEFVEVAPRNTQIDTHTHAHVFGEALYAEAGIDAVQHCDGSFEFGCYHSFFGMAVYEHGIGVLPRFDQACQDVYGEQHLPCQHGIGHGILVHTGYDSLEDALALCETISWQETGGCSSGVFMEYNFHTMETLRDDTYVRPLTEGVYAPCAELDAKYQPSCYFEQVQWWRAVYEGDYERIGTLCSSLERERTETACFHGVGNYVAADADLDPAGIERLCKDMPSDRARALCHEGASWLVRGDGSGMENARAVCTTLEDPHREACLQKL